MALRRHLQRITTTILPLHDLSSAHHPRHRTIPLSFPTANIAEFISPSATASAPPELASLPIAVIVWFFVALVTAVAYTAYAIQKCSGLDGLDSADISNLQFSLIMTTHSAGGALGTERDEQSEEIGALRNDIQALEARLATKEEQLHNYVQSLESANASVARLESRLEEEANQIKVHEGSIQAARETIKVLNSRLEAQSADYGHRLSQMAAQLSDHKAQLASKDEQLTISAAEIQRLQRRQLEGSEEEEIGSPKVTGGNKAEATAEVDVQHLPRRRCNHLLSRSLIRLEPNPRLHHSRTASWVAKIIHR